MSKAPATEARHWLQETLEGLGLTIYPAPPETVTPPAAVVMPGDPWVQPLTYGKTQVTLEVIVLASLSGSNAAAYDRLEDSLWRITQTLEGKALVGPAKAPRIQTFGAAQVAAADLTITIHMEDSAS
jgi:3-deoxy-D-manno-octulosonic-acid transferase